MADSIFNIIKEDNKKYEKNDYNGKMTSTKDYKVIQGKIPILLSAPHGVKQVRNKKIKWEDAMTGGIVEYLCDTINAFGIIRTCNLNDDPNYNNDSLSLQYKNEKWDERNAGKSHTKILLSPAFLRYVLVLHPGRKIQG